MPSRDSGSLHSFVTAVVGETLGIGEVRSFRRGHQRHVRLHRAARFQAVRAFSGVLARQSRPGASRSSFPRNPTTPSRAEAPAELG